VAISNVAGVRHRRADPGQDAKAAKNRRYERSGRGAAMKEIKLLVDYESLTELVYENLKEARKWLKKDLKNYERVPVFSQDQEEDAREIKKYIEALTISMKYFGK
jgi:hypothetical protein